jgi:hypothetical protein
MSEQPSSSDPTTEDAARPQPRRGRAKVVVLLGGFVGTLGGLVSIALVVSFAFSGSSSWGLASLLALILSVVGGGIVASLGFRGLGVRPGVRSALLGAFTGAIGFLGPWLTAALLARF